MALDGFYLRWRRPKPILTTEFNIHEHHTDNSSEDPSPTAAAASYQSVPLTQCCAGPFQDRAACEDFLMVLGEHDVILWAKIYPSSEHKEEYEEEEPFQGLD